MGRTGYVHRIGKFNENKNKNYRKESAVNMMGDSGYDYEDELRENPLVSSEAFYNMQLCNAIATGTAYERFGYDPDGTEKERRENLYLEYDPGVHSRCFKGTSDRVNREANKFHQTMYKKYENYDVIDTTGVQLANGTALYVTFSV